MIFAKLVFTRISTELASEEPFETTQPKSVIDAVGGGIDSVETIDVLELVLGYKFDVV
jgi:hypothetical protein